MLIHALFYVFAAVLVLAALGVITSRNPVYSALLLVLCFITSAAIWLLVEAEFLAVVLILVYVGAVMVLFLFVVMMLDIDLFKCIYCGFCEEACPVDAIVLTRIHEYHMEKRGENIMSKDKLLAVGERYEAMISADKDADARYR